MKLQAGIETAIPAAAIRSAARPAERTVFATITALP